MDLDYFYNGTEDSKPLIDLVVLTYNSLEVTKNFINCLYSNTSENDIRLILIDNGSEDGTPDYIEKYLKNKNTFKNNFYFIKNSENLGVIKGRNLGYEFSKNLPNRADYLMILDNDQYVQKGWMEQHLGVLKRGYDLIGVEAWQINNRFIPYIKNIQLNQPFTYVGCGGMLMKKEVPDTIGRLFDDIYSPAYFEDPDLNFEAYNKNFKIGWNIKAKIIHFPHQTLGKFNHNERQQMFKNSWEKFRNKWKNYKMPIIKQEHLPEFD